MAAFMILDSASFNRFSIFHFAFCIREYASCHRQRLSIFKLFPLQAIYSISNCMARSAAHDQDPPDHDHDESADSASETSRTPSNEHDQEPIETFRHRVARLCCAQWQSSTEKRFETKEYLKRSTAYSSGTRRFASNDASDAEVRSIFRLVNLRLPSRSGAAQYCRVASWRQRHGR